MKQQKSQTKEGSDGYIRVCADCTKDMHWMWGGKITYFLCSGCNRIEPCSNIVIDKINGQVIKEDGNKKETICAFTPDEFNKILETVLT